MQSSLDGNFRLRRNNNEFYLMTTAYGVDCFIFYGRSLFGAMVSIISSTLQKKCCILHTNLKVRRMTWMHYT